tara:strand:+ start:3066 stop:4301 length:1236 start_codon:yes stop_codon:yes gene_type:complete
LLKNDSEKFNLLTPQNERDNIQLGLSNMNLALNKLNNPCLDIPAIQIVGTNGKGSITAFLEKILCKANINIGVTTSPHLLEINERIRVNGRKIKEDEFINLLNQIQEELNELKLTPFELIICCSLKYFNDRNVNFLLLEAGLGGRLDATTAHRCRPIIALGNIGIDHKEYLGKTIEEITQEKVAVIKTDSIVVSCNQNSKVKKIINERVNKIGAKIHWVKPLSDNWELGLKGYFQKQNAAVAKGVIKILSHKGISISKEIIKSSLKETKWPGRLDLLTWKNNKILVDCAHNPSAAKALAKEREHWSNQEEGVFWIIGMQKQKDIINFLKEIIRPLDKLLLIQIPGHQSWCLEDIIKNSNQSFICFDVMEFKDFNSIFKFLEGLDEWPCCHPVLTGSIFLIAEFLKFRKINS